MEDAAPAPHLTLIGTGHVLDIADAIRNAVVALRPDIVFVELDRGRLQALQMRRAGREPPVQGGWLQKRLHTFQESIASEYGVRAGDEMLAAVDGALLTGAQVGLVDRPVQQTLARVRSQITLAERLRAVGMVAGGAIKGLFHRGSARDSVEEELAGYVADPVGTLGDLRGRFPTVHRVVIAERDAWMARGIESGLAGHKRGVAVVGDGHVDGLMQHLAPMDMDVYRLNDVREGRLPRPHPDDTSSARFSFTVGDEPPQPL